MPNQNNSSGYSPPQSKGRRMLRGTLLGLTVITLLNLLLTASLSGLIGSVLILIMVWGIRKGDYGLRKALVVFLFLYAGVNLVVLVLSACFSASARILSMIWLGIYSLGLLGCAYLLRRKEIRTWLEIAPQPAEKEKKIHFFHGGWRDL